MPTAKRLRAHGEARPLLGREQPARRSKQHAVSGRVLCPPPTAPEDRELMAQDDDLELPLTAGAGEHANEAAQEPVQHTRQHHPSSEPVPHRSPAGPARRFKFLYPTSLGSLRSRMASGAGAGWRVGFVKSIILISRGMLLAQSGLQLATRSRPPVSSRRSGGHQASAV